ncbi:MAG: SPOR domain-containing protein [Treponemataceae bacterium]|nr:SPOR domain-containing protein [Treponemataceae bacterium]
MEERRTLWIITASGLFLLVVVGAAIILSTSTKGTKTQQAAFNPTEGWTTPTTYAVQAIPTNDTIAQANTNAVSDAPASPFDQVALNDTAVPQQIQADNLTVYADKTTVYSDETVTTIDLNALKSSTPAVTANNPTTAAQIASTQAAKTESYTYNYEQPKPVAKAPPAPTQTPAPAKPAPAPAAASAPAKTAAPAKSTVPASLKVPDRFWVQVASYATKKNADDARATLESNKIPSEVFTYTDAKGKVFYRVRIGSYTTSSEAEYWKTQVAKIDQFADAQSYVVNSSAKAIR